MDSHLVIQERVETTEKVETITLAEGMKTLLLKPHPNTDNTNHKEIREIASKCHLPSPYEDNLPRQKSSTSDKKAAATTKAVKATPATLTTSLVTNTTDKTKDTEINLPTPLHTLEINVM